MAKAITIQDFQKWTPGKKAQWLGDAAKLALLPDAALPKNLLDARLKARHLKNEISPGSGVTFGDVANQQKYAEGLTFNAGDKELADRTINAAAGRQGSADWFKTYQQQVTGAADRAGAAVTAAGENNRGLFDSMNRVSQADTARVQDALRGRAAELGQSAPDAGGLQGAQGAAAARAAMLGSAAITSNNEAANNAQFRNVAVNAAGLADNQNQNDWTARDKVIAGDKTAYAEKKGLWRQKFLDDAINAARKGVLEDKAFGIQSAAAQAKAKLERDKLNSDNSNKAKDRWLKQYIQDHPNYKPTAPKAPDKRTISQNRTVKNSIANALLLIATMRKAPDAKTGKMLTTSQMRAALAGGKYDHDVINTAMDIAYLKRIGSTNYKSWVNNGYNPSSWGWGH